MLLIVKLICKECYKKKYGDQPKPEFGIPNRVTEEKTECEDCGKVDYLIYTTEPIDPKKCKWKF